MEEHRLLIDLHRQGYRQGPGGDGETERALDLARVDRLRPLQVADLGCGTGASTLVLARLLDARITAVDFLQEFLDVLEERAASLGVADRITTLACSIDDLPFADGAFDLLWAEGAIYNIGFRRGITEWRRLLRPGGLLVASEITWLTQHRPAELQSYWQDEYPEIDLASAKIGALEQNGYTPVGYFVLPEHCWLDHYYVPLQARFNTFLARNGNSPEAVAIVEAEQGEIELYRNHRQHYGYGVYIARKLGS
jgi:SAM-dependent methyltransferase